MKGLQGGLKRVTEKRNGQARGVWVEKDRLQGRMGVSRCLGGYHWNERRKRIRLGFREVFWLECNAIGDKLQQELDYEKIQKEPGGKWIKYQSWKQVTRGEDFTSKKERPSGRIVTIDVTVSWLLDLSNFILILFDFYRYGFATLEKPPKILPVLGKAFDAWSLRPSRFFPLWVLNIVRKTDGWGHPVMTKNCNGFEPPCNIKKRTRRSSNLNTTGRVAISAMRFISMYDAVTMESTGALSSTLGLELKLDFNL